MHELEGKVAFITGGGSGVGLGQAKVFAEEAGMKVVIADIRREALDEALGYFDGRDVEVHAIALDLTDRAAFAAAADETESRFGPVQLLCNTAGVSQFGPVEQATYNDWDWQIDVNLRGVINGIQNFVPRMIAHGQGGYIVNTASMAALLSLPKTAIYSATKYAVRGLSEILRRDLARYDIGVSCLCPGEVNSNIHRAVETRPDHYAETGYYGREEAVFGAIKQMIEKGIDPVDLGRIVLDAVRRREFWILPNAEFASAVDEGHQELMRAFAAYRDHPDYLRRERQRAAAGGGTVAEHGIGDLGPADHPR